MIAIFKTVTGIYHYCNMSEATRPFVVNKCMYVSVALKNSSLPAAGSNRRRLILKCENAAIVAAWLMLPNFEY